MGRRWDRLPDYLMVDGQTVLSQQICAKVQPHPPHLRTVGKPVGGGLAGSRRSWMVACLVGGGDRVVGKDTLGSESCSGNWSGVFEKGILGDHETVAKATEVGSVSHFLGKDIAGVDDARDVENLNGMVEMAFANLILAKVDMLETFGRDRGGPLNARLVVVVDGNATIGVSHAKVLGPQADGLDVSDTFICSNDLGFAGAESGLVLTKRAPGDGPP